MNDRKFRRLALHVMTACIVLVAFVVQTPSALAGGHGVTSASASVSVTVLDPATVSSIQPLSFGAVTPPRNGRTNTISLEPGGRLTISGGGNATLAKGQTATPGVFEIAGPPNTAYSLTQTLRLFGAGLGSHEAGGAPAETPSAGVLPSSGVQQVRIGGVFRIDSTASPGDHAGVLELIASYN